MSSGNRRHQECREERALVERRAFIGALALSALAPLAAAAQQAPKVPRLSYLSSGSSAAGGYIAFRQGLRELGYVEGRDITFEDRFADGRSDRLPSLAAELVRLKVDVIVAASPPAIRAAKGLTKTIPIVMLSGGDAVRSGFVVSLARPGGNVTGVAILASVLMAKQLDLLKQLVPAVRRVAILWDPSMDSIPDAAKDSELQSVTGSLGIRVQPVEVRQPADYERAFVAMAKDHAGAVVVMGSPTFIRDRRWIVDLAAKHRLPAAYLTREEAKAGGLIAYGPDLSDLSRRAALYAECQSSPEGQAECQSLADQDAEVPRDDFHSRGGRSPKQDGVAKHNRVQNEERLFHSRCEADQGR